MTQQKHELLVDYLDKKLNPAELSEVELMIQQDEPAASELEYLKLAVDTVRLNAINGKVQAVRQSMDIANKDTSTTGHGIVRSMYKTTLRIAVILVILFSSAVLYKYISVSNQSLYKNQFIPYEMSNMRGSEDRNPVAEAYQNKNWNLVVESFNAEKIKSNKTVFMAAMAEMQLKHYSQAGTLFQNILSNNSDDSSFREEAEYYCALVYLMDQKESAGIAMINKIKADPSHRYFPLASKISGIDLKIIDLKK